MQDGKVLSENVRRLRFMSAQQSSKPAAAAAAAAAAAKGKGWFAPGWEQAEAIYEQQQQQQQQEAADANPQYELLLFRRSFGGFNPFIESLNKKQIKKAAAAAAKRAERDEALMLHRSRQARQTPF
ncbi:hypothetical protein, conserved [Eimeria tenella]|uniref:Uncharacterized protein n=1 Tax=Eimeria tenella TaxID=5802 RepID=U6L9T2_EIMTE|nr:hypothetical protein, conserved [Eimeria tenella]CDJ44525.1 hypothetical protein, conserved [Eimeria tenella]|eukprot:XP_013235273.1 hypothetical protein, conserved [Eimeria tenella]